MEFTIRKDIIASIVSHMEKVINQKTDIPILLNMKVDTTGDDITVTASSSACTLIMRSKLEKKEESELHFCVNAQQLGDALHDMPNEPIKFDLGDNGRLFVRSSTGYAYMPTFPAEDFIEFPIYEYKETMHIPGVWLQDALKRAAWATAKDELRKAMTGIHLAQSEGGIDAVATDGRALVLQHTFVEGQPEQANASFTLPKDVASLISRMDLPSDIMVEWSETAAHIQILSNDLYFTLCTDQYPNYKAVMNISAESGMELPLVDLISALRRVAPFVEKSSKVIVSTNENGMELQCDNEYTGSGAYDFIQKLDSTGECVKFAVDAQLLMSGLKILPAMNVMVKARDERHSILIVPSDGDEADEITVLLMPMRIESD